MHSQQRVSCWDGCVCVCGVCGDGGWGGVGGWGGGRGTYCVWTDFHTRPDFGIPRGTTTGRATADSDTDDCGGGVAALLTTTTFAFLLLFFTAAVIALAASLMTAAAGVAGFWLRVEVRVPGRPIPPGFRGAGAGVI